MSPFGNSRKADKQNNPQPQVQKRTPRNHWGGQHTKSSPPELPAFSQIVKELELEEESLPPQKPVRSPEATPGSYDMGKTKKYLREPQPGEEVRRVYHRHWVALIYKSWIPLVALLPLFAIYSFVSASLKALTAPVVLLLVVDLAVLIWCWVDYRNDYLVITSRRIIHKEKIVFFEEDDTEIRLDKVQEVRLETSRGMLEWLFRVGTIFITSTGNARITFNRIHLPEQVRNEIDEEVLQWRYENRELRRQRAAARIENRVVSHFMGDQDTPDTVFIPPKLPFWKGIFPTGKAVFYDEKDRSSLVWFTHPWILVQKTFWKTIQFILTILVFIFPLQWWVFPLNISLVNNVVGGLFVILLIIQIIRLLLIYDNWHNDRFIVKPDELMVINREPFGFNQYTGVIKLHNAQDVQSEQIGMMANLLNFGTVTITAAGTGKPIKFTNVPRPEEVEAEISRRIDAAKLNKENLDDNLTMDSIATFFQKNEEYIQKRALEQRPPRGDYR